MDTDFWEEVIQQSSEEDLDWLAIRIRRRKESLHPEITAHRAIIRQKL